MYTNPESADRLRHLLKDVVAPLGPTLKRLGRDASPVALLESFTTCALGGPSSRGWKAPSVTFLQRARLDPRVVYEETILRDGLDDVKVLYAPQCIFLTPDIVAKIEKQLRGGKDVLITSGLLRALQDRGIRNIVDIEYTDRKAMATAIKAGWAGMTDTEKPILMQQIGYKTNDSWEMVSGMDGGLGWPILHRGLYGSANLYVLVVPDNFSDLYRFPASALNIIRQTASARTMPVYIEGGYQAWSRHMKKPQTWELLMQYTIWACCMRKVME